MRPLEPLNLPLHGCLLLEASAGTGKTYTLALLFLRLLLEQGLSVDQILVVTFTRAATGELRDRIRRRIREALLTLDHDGSEDVLLQELHERIDPLVARQRLGDALVRMDEAAIHTIHGFSQRVLQEHAFESATSFAVELMDNDLVLQREILEDFWRNRFYRARDAEAHWALQTFGDPGGLLKALGKAATTDCRLVPEVSAESAASLELQATEGFAQVQQILRQDLPAVEHILCENSCLKRSEKDYRLKDRVPELCRTMESWIDAPTMPYHLEKEVEKLAWSVMAEKLKKKCEPPEHPFFHAFDRFYQLHQQFVRELKFLVLAQARDFLRHTLAQRKQRLGLLAFDDLLTQLETALARPGSGPRLAAALRSRYPVALVDEFQDTDPVQYRLFSHIYRAENATLCMIGDPKQAIYSFRGADIFTYMEARQQTEADSRYTMGVNFRSTPAMVQAVNRLFGLREDAFVFSDAIEFEPVSAAAAKADSLRIDGRAVPPMSGLLLDQDGLKKANKATISKDLAREVAALFCADQIIRLLEAGDDGRAAIGGRPLGTADIAILVRTHREAEAMQAALRLRGINSLYLGQSSIFESSEAGQLFQVLSALVDCTDAGRIRTCLATELFGLSGKAIHGLGDDEQAWAARMVALQQYRQIWQEQGFMAMFQHLLVREGVTRRLTGRIGGERSLTNYLHLAELLQQSPAGEHGAAALQRWLRRQLDNPDAKSEAQLIRLENDEQLVRIVTIHRAKGLEFPVVFLPFLWNGRPLSKDEPLQFHDRDTYQLTIDWGSGEEAHGLLAEEERLAEELRLLYVALTRAKSCCYFCWGLVSGLEWTGLAYLLHQGRCPQNEATMVEDMDQLNRTEHLLALHSCPAEFSRNRLRQAKGLVELAPLLFNGRILAGWTMTSYSRLSSEGPAPIDQTERDEPRSLLTPPVEDFRSPFSFPRGATAGTCLHSLLERLDFNRPAGEQQPLIAEVLEQGGIDLRWQEAAAHWLDDILAMDLPGSCALRQIAGQDRINELNFLFPLEQVDMHRFNALLETAGFRATALSVSSLQGLMKGFIDLVFRHQGRYFIVDYKSNYLGASHSDYGPEALEGCMESHQYHLQLLIYTLALHRFLRVRLREYEYETHLGGVYYLFLRAMGPEQSPTSGIYSLRPGADLIEALDICCRGEG
ncbi:MAG: exodeoxyribonuclease V subunit beta [Desulfobulbus sp.]|nr:exodeoxyribonuclease V subunit beta [Desulfobulbus sp.]